MNLCNAVVNLHRNIQAAVIVRRAEISERFIRPGVPTPQPEDLEGLLMRAELMVTMTRASDKLFGPTDYVFTSHSNLDTFIFPYNDSFLIVPVVKPYDHQSLAKGIFELISRH